MIWAGSHWVDRHQVTSSCDYWQSRCPVTWSCDHSKACEEEAVRKEFIKQRVPWECQPSCRPHVGLFSVQMCMNGNGMNHDMYTAPWIFIVFIHTYNYSMCCTDSCLSRTTCRSWIFISAPRDSMLVMLTLQAELASKHSNKDCCPLIWVINKQNKKSSFNAFYLSPLILVHGQTFSAVPFFVTHSEILLNVPDLYFVSTLLCWSHLISLVHNLYPASKV